MILLDGKKTSNDIKEEIAIEVAQLISSGGKRPHLAAILVGNDGASETYVNAKVKDCEKVGFQSTLVRLEDKVSEEDLLAAIEQINQDASIDGLIVQLALPKHIDEEVARLHLDHLNIKLTELTTEQEEYSGINKEGPYKPDTYRY